jgi:hypothetical protein
MKKPLLFLILIFYCRRYICARQKFEIFTLPTADAGTAPKEMNRFYGK